jgi:hypothetical protein
MGVIVVYSMTLDLTGVANGNSAISSNNSKLLSISLDLEKNPIIASDRETLTIRVVDAANSNETIAGARVNGTVTDPTNTTISKFNGTTDKSGIFTYKWKINKDTKPGAFTVGVLASATGYQNQSAPTRTTFNVNSEAVHNHKTVLQNKAVNCRLFILSTGPCS